MQLKHVIPGVFINVVITIFLIYLYHTYYLPKHNYCYEVYTVDMSKVISLIEQKLRNEINLHGFNNLNVLSYTRAVDEALNKIAEREKKKGKRVLFLLKEAVVRGDVRDIDVVKYLPEELKALLYQKSSETHTLDRGLPFLFPEKKSGNRYKNRW